MLKPLNQIQPTIRRILDRLQYSPAAKRSPAAAVSFKIGKLAFGGFLDSVQIDPGGMIRILGWCKGDFNPDYPIPSVYLDARPVPFLQHYRYRRPDIVANETAHFAQLGLTLEYLVPQSMRERFTRLEIALEGNDGVAFEADFSFITPHYVDLLNTSDTLHRENIYGSGPPNGTVNPELLELAEKLKGPLLDFGCGQGALIRQLRRMGIDCCGLELNSAIIRDSIPQDSTNMITLYNGMLPSPFEDGRFRSVICSEVLEHIADYESAVRDIARITRETALFTVPDASAIPIGFRHGAVPWHLLEATHVNFFNQQSLKKVLAAYFSNVEFGRLGWARFNDSEFYVSLAAFCVK